MPKPKIVFATGKRKTAVARVVIKPGNGMIKVNSKPLDYWTSEWYRLRVREPLILAEDIARQVDIIANVKGGGVSAQADALRLAIARGLVQFARSKKLKELFEEYDRNLVVADPRRNEPHKAKGASRRGSRRHKQRSKR